MTDFNSIHWGFNQWSKAGTNYAPSLKTKSLSSKFLIEASIDFEAPPFNFIYIIPNHNINIYIEVIYDPRTNQYRLIGHLVLETYISSDNEKEFNREIKRISEDNNSPYGLIDTYICDFNNNEDRWGLLKLNNFNNNLIYEFYFKGTNRRDKQAYNGRLEELGIKLKVADILKYLFENDVAKYVELFQAKQGKDKLPEFIIFEAQSNSSDNSGLFYTYMLWNDDPNYATLKNINLTRKGIYAYYKFPIEPTAAKMLPISGTVDNLHKEVDRLIKNKVPTEERASIRGGSFEEFKELNTDLKTLNITQITGETITGFIVLNSLKGAWGKVLVEQTKDLGVTDSFTGEIDYKIVQHPFSPPVIIDVQFEKDKYDILKVPEHIKAEDQSALFIILDEVFVYLNFYTQVKLELRGYTSSEGTEEHNKKLSEDRVNSVAEYLIDKGLAPERIIANGFGEIPDTPEDESARKVEIYYTI